MSSRRAIPAAALAGLVHHRWAIPLVAALHREQGAKFVTLATRLGVGRESLSRSLAALTGAGLVKRNPGYGHPMRPEYVLTRRGTALGGASAELMEAVRKAGVEDVALRKWSLPVLLAVGTGCRRFSRIQRELAGASPRAVSLGLRELEDAGLLERTVGQAYPPAPEYRLSAAARALLGPLRKLSRGL